MSRAPDKTLILPRERSWPVPMMMMGGIFLFVALDGFVTLTRRAGFQLGIVLFFGFIASIAGLILLTGLHGLLDRVKLVLGDDGTVTLVTHRWPLRRHWQVLSLADIREVIVEHDEGSNIVLVTEGERIPLTSRGEGTGEVDPKLVAELEAFLGLG